MPQTKTDSVKEFDFTGKDFERVRAMIYKRAGIALADSKQEMVYSRLARRLRATGISSFVRYLDDLEAGRMGDEWEAFTNALTTNLTSFFREAHHFPLLAEHVKKLSGPITIWCSASSTGEEPYSIAMTVCEAFNTLTPPVTIIDVIFCRNVMIYFDKATQRKILSRFVPLMKPDALLFAGHSENFLYVSDSLKLRGKTVYELDQPRGAAPKASSHRT